MSLRIFGAKDTSSAVIFIELLRRDHWSDFSVLAGELWRERFQNSTLHCVPLIADDRVLALKAVDVGAGSAIEVGSDPLESGMIKMMRKSEEELFEGMIRIVFSLARSNAASKNDCHFCVLDGGRPEHQA